jgi:chemotaxis protein histidine kinase CheA
MDKLDELRLRYWRSLPQKAQDLQAHWQRVQQRPDERAPVVEFQQQVHKLSGSAPAYGFDAIGALARPVDHRLSEWLRGDDAEAAPDAQTLFRLLASPVAALIAALESAADGDLPPA